jgi:hypothetical protein
LGAPRDFDQMIRQAVIAAGAAYAAHVACTTDNLQENSRRSQDRLQAPIPIRG